MAGLALSVMPTGVIARQGARHYQLTAEPAPHFVEDRPAATILWLLYRQSPGPPNIREKG